MFRTQIGRLRARKQWPVLRQLPARWESTLPPPPPLINIKDGTFYRSFPSKTDAESSSLNPPIFPNLTFSLPANANEEYWSIISPSTLSRTTFLQILHGEYIAVPPTARTYPYLSSDHIKDPRFRYPQTAIKYVGFDAERGGSGGTAVKGAYLSARYEAHREITDWSLKDYLEGNTQLNALEKGEDAVDQELLERVVHNLRLTDLLTMPVSNLSNGQTRRARIAKSLLSKPELLLLDGPFMGLDPLSVEMISRLLHDMAKNSAPRLVLSLRPEDQVPDWISHLVYIDSSLNVLGLGEKKSVIREIASGNRKDLAEDIDIANKIIANTPSLRETDESLKSRKPRASRAKAAEATEQETEAEAEAEPYSRDGFPQHDPPSAEKGEPIVEMQGVTVTYNAHDASTRRTVLGDWTQPTTGGPSRGLHWTIHRNHRTGIFGPNGSGKTTLLSLITSDHPQTYALPIKLFGRSRLPEPGQPGLSIFELQARMGHSSPEVHAYFPKQLSVRRVLESAWAETPLSRPLLTHAADRRVDACLRWFAAELNPTGHSLLEDLQLKLDSRKRRREKSSVAIVDEVRQTLKRAAGNSDDLDWADSTRFAELPFSGQRLLLFLKAVVKQPDLVILDEAFSGIDEKTRDKCLLFLSHGENKVRRSERLGRKKEVVTSICDSIVKGYGDVVVEGLNDQQALLVISHSKEDVPGCIRNWICLPEPGEGKPPRWGTLPGPLEMNPASWDDIWGVEKKD